MRVLQVVTLVSSDGAFGGPVAVAKSQSRALAAAGCQATLVAGWDGKASARLPDVLVKLVKVRPLVPGGGFSGLGSLALLRALRRSAREVDVVHVHFGRDLVSGLAARAALRAGVPLVLQTHGMVRPDRRFLVRVFHWAFVEIALRRARLVLCLTEAERADLEALGVSRDRIVAVTNGVEDRHARAREGRALPPEVLFLSRLHPRKGATVFVRAALEVLKHEPDARFSIVGPDEGDLARVLELIKKLGLQDSVTYAGPAAPDEAIDRFAAASVFVLPSRGEVIPMAVLEALSVGTPVVISDDCGLADDLRRRRAATVVAPEPAAVASAVLELIRDDAKARTQRENGLNAIAKKYSASAVASRLIELYNGLSTGYDHEPRTGAQGGSR